MSDILIRSLPSQTLRQAKMLAAKHHRSLQQEISEMLVETIRFRAGGWSVEADKIRKRLNRKRKLYSDSTAQVREDRDR